MVVVFLLLSLGVIFSDWVPVRVPWFWLTVSGLIFVLLSCYQKSAQVTWYIVFFTIVMFGASQHQHHKETLESDRLFDMASEDWEPVVLEGIIESTPRWRPDAFKIRGEPTEKDLQDDSNWQTAHDISVVSVRDGSNWVNGLFGKMTVVTQGRIRNLLPGDRVRCRIQWQQILPPTNPGQFDYQTKSKQESIRIRGRADSAEQMELLEVEQLWRLDRLLARVIRRSDETFHHYVFFDQACMASALVINQRDQVEYQMQESLLATGTIHMLAISGMHIDLLAITVSILCVVVGLSRKWTIGITIVIVLSYTLLCGGNPPVARAAILVVSMGLFNWIGKTVDVLNLLGFAAVCIMLHRPAHWMEVGTQLSFLSVAILILIAGDESQRKDRFNSIDDLLRERSSIAMRVVLWTYATILEMLRTSFWICLLLMPLILYRMNVISPIAIILNLVLWIPMTVGLLSGLLLLTFATWLPWVGYIIGFVCGLSLAISNTIVRWSETIPGGHFWLPAPTFAWLLTFYIVTAFSILFFGFGSQCRKMIVAFATVWILVAIGPAMDQQLGPCFFPRKPVSPGKLIVTFIDVGHGTSVLLETPDAKTWLYDAGRMGDAQRSSLGIAAVLWHNKLSSLDGLFLSHADSDHFNAIPGLSKRFAIKQLFTTQQVIDSDSTTLKEVLESIRRRSIPIYVVSSTDSLETTIANQRDQFRGYSFQIIHPTRSEPSSALLSEPTSNVSNDTTSVESSKTGNSASSKHSSKAPSDNSDSLCLLIEYAGRKILLPGDLEGTGLRRVTEKPSCDIDILMAPHHGSLTQDPTSIMNWSTPEWVVVSGGTRAKSPRVKQAFEGNNRKLLITAQHHAVRFIVSQEGTIETQRYTHPNWITLDKQLENDSP